MDLSKDLVAASATPIILAILKNRPSYGYAIIRKVQEISKNEIAWTDGMLYPVLHRLEASGFISSFWRTSENGRRRRYYEITNAGIEELLLLKKQWEMVRQALLTLEKEYEGESQDV